MIPKEKGERLALQFLELTLEVSQFVFQLVPCTPVEEVSALLAEDAELNLFDFFSDFVSGHFYLPLSFLSVCIITHVARFVKHYFFFFFFLI